MNFDNLSCFKVAFATAGGALIGYLGGWDKALQSLLLFIVVDYITGVAAAWYTKQLSSEIGMRGIVKKVCFFIPVGICYYFDQELGQDYLRSMAIMGYTINELVSIIENLDKMNVWIPEFIRKALAQRKALFEKKEGDIDA